jgi:hypothetical protein
MTRRALYLPLVALNGVEFSPPMLKLTVGMMVSLNEFLDYPAHLLASASAPILSVCVVSRRNPKGETEESTTYP